MFKTVLLISMLVLTQITFAHKFYVSTANMEFNSVTNTIDVSLKLTAHDFEYVLENKFNQRIHLETVADSTEIGKFYINYLAENFVITSEEKPTVFHYLGKEVTLRDELFLYFYFKDVANPKSIQIKNTLLFKEFAQQQNIINYKYGEMAKSVTLVASKPQEEIKFN